MIMYRPPVCDVAERGAGARSSCPEARLQALDSRDLRRHSGSTSRPCTPPRSGAGKDEVSVSEVCRSGRESKPKYVSRTSAVEPNRPALELDFVEVDRESNALSNSSASRLTSSTTSSLAWTLRFLTHCICHRARPAQVPFGTPSPAAYQPFGTRPRRSGTGILLGFAMASASSYALGL